MLFFIFDNSYSKRCEVISYCSLICIFLIIMLIIFSCACCPPLCLLWKCLFRFCVHFFSQVVCYFVIELYYVFYVFWILRPYQIYDLQIYFYSVSCFFILRWFSLLWGNILVWCSPVCLFCFCFSCLSIQSDKNLTLMRSTSVRLLPTFSSKNFMDSCLIFKSIHFEFIFLYGVR